MTAVATDLFISLLCERKSQSGLTAAISKQTPSVNFSSLKAEYESKVNWRDQSTALVLLICSRERKLKYEEVYQGSK